MSWKPPLRFLLIAASFVWAAKLSFILFAETNSEWRYVALILVPVFVVLTARSVQTYFKVCFDGKPDKASLLRYGIVACQFSAFQVLPFVPDVFSTFLGEAAWKGAAYFLLFSVASILILGAFRAIPFALLALRKPRSLTLFPALGAWFFGEAVLACFIPVLSLAALPLPLPLSPASREGVFVAREEPRGDVKDIDIVLVDPRFQSEENLGDLKSHLKERVFALSGVWRAYAMNWQSLPGEVLVLFPETAFDLTSETMLELSELLGEQIKEAWESRKSGIQRSNGRADNAPIDLRVSVVAGAIYLHRNVVVFSGPHPITGVPVAGILHTKKRLVPLFERRFGTLSLRNSGEVYTEGILPAGAMLDPGIVRQLPWVVQPNALAVCYEALDPLSWIRGNHRTVITNHALFSRYFVVSRLYDIHLRTLAYLFGSPLVLVGNFGETGVFLPGDAPSVGLEKQPPWRVRFVRLKSGSRS